MERSPIADRIEKLLEFKTLTIKVFSDELGVQRSSLSHILSGRNKPSLDFILKILATYPEVNEKWLLHGKGEYLKSPESAIESTHRVIPESIKAIQNDTFVNEQEVTNVTNDFRANVTNVSSADAERQNKPSSLITSALEKSTKTIKQVVILYSDGSFEAFHPDQKLG